MTFPLIPADDAALERVLRRGTVEAIVEADLARALRDAKRPLRIKFGIDPSSPDIHLGHGVVFRKLRHFQELGHTIVIIIGDWTAQIGDPTGRSETRKMLTADEVKANAKTYTDQLFRVIAPDQTEIRWQTEWFGAFSLADVVRLTSHYTVAQMLARDDFRKRFDANQPLAIVEFLYPLLQGYDSVAIQSDVELGGTEQKFNLLVGRDMQLANGQHAQHVLTVPLLVGTDGVRKMSKSLGNYVGVDESANEQFAKLMSIPDDVIVHYAELASDLDDDELRRLRESLSGNQENPRDIKRRVASDIVRQYHGEAGATAADAEWIRRFSNREVPEDVPDAPIPAAWFGPEVKLVDLLTESGIATSKSEARRQIEGNGVRLRGEPAIDEIVTVETGDILQFGRRKVVRLVPA